jgi:hypothetical protein
MSSDYKDVGFRLVTGFIGRLQILITIKSLFLTLCSSLQHALRLLSFLSLHQSSGTCLQRPTFTFSGSRTVPVPQSR